MMQGRGKEIALLALAVGALALAIYTFRGKPQGTPAPPAAPAAPVEAAEEVAEVAEATEGGEAGTEEASSGEAAGGQKRNPFSMATGEAAEPAGGGEPGPAEPAPGGEMSEQPTDTAFRLEGIVTGPPTVAVIRHGDKPYFVKVGDEIGDGYRVDAIRSGREVVLAGERGTIVLRTGKPS